MYDQGLSGAQWFWIWAGNVAVFWVILYMAVRLGVVHALDQRERGSKADKAKREKWQRGY